MVSKVANNSSQDSTELTRHNPQCFISCQCFWTLVSTWPLMNGGGNPWINVWSMGARSHSLAFFLCLFGKYIMETEIKRLGENFIKTWWLVMSQLQMLLLWKNITVFHIPFSEKEYTLPRRIFLTYNLYIEPK